MRLQPVARFALALLLGAPASGCTETGRVLTGRHAAVQGASAQVVADRIAAGPYQTCALSGGDAYCWGAGDSGELGNGDASDRDVPTRLDAGSDWREIAVGERHTCGLRQGGSLWCWGGNESGQLGLGSVAPVLEPSFVSTPAPVTRITTKYGHTCAIYDDGSLWCWGANQEGQLGQDEPYAEASPNHLAPIQVGTDADWLAVSTGQGHTCGIRAPGTLWCWGRNSDDELGLGPLGPDVPGQSRAPLQVGTGDDWSEVRAGQSGTCALRGGGELWCWGAAFSATNAAYHDVPTRIGSDADWLDVSLDTFQVCGLRAGGTVFCWGRNLEGQLGLGDNTDRLDPAEVAGTWAAVSAGRFHTCARGRDDTVWCAGKNSRGQLGSGDLASANTFRSTAPAM